MVALVFQSVHSCCSYALPTDQHGDIHNVLQMVKQSAWRLVTTAITSQLPIDYFGDGQTAKLFEVGKRVKVGSHLTEEETHAIVLEVLGVGDPFSPMVFTIDKAPAERAAIRAVFGEKQPIKLCEFHVAQALLRWFKGVVPPEVAQAISFDFRCTFVSRTYTEFAAAHTTFVNAVSARISSGSVRMKVLKYFQVNWFSKTWLPYLLDAGMPESLPRNDFGTNNMLETLFRAFDTMILRNTVNRHVIGLLEKLVVDWIPHYVAVIKAGPSPYLGREQTRRWRALARGAEVLAHKVSTSLGSQDAYVVPRSPSTLTKFVRVDFLTPPPRCSCSDFELFGRTCEHILAVAMWSTSGSKPPAPGSNDELSEWTQQAFAVETRAAAADNGADNIDDDGGAGTGGVDGDGGPGAGDMDDDGASNIDIPSWAACVELHITPEEHGTDTLEAPVTPTKSRTPGPAAATKSTRRGRIEGTSAIQSAPACKRNRHHITPTPTAARTPTVQTAAKHQARKHLDQPGPPIDLSSDTDFDIIAPASPGPQRKRLRVAPPILEHFGYKFHLVYDSVIRNTIWSPYRVDPAKDAPVDPDVANNPQYIPLSHRQVKIRGPTNFACLNVDQLPCFSSANTNGCQVHYRNACAVNAVAMALTHVLPSEPHLKVDRPYLTDAPVAQPLFPFLSPDHVESYSGHGGFIIGFGALQCMVNDVNDDVRWGLGPLLVANMLAIANREYGEDFFGSSDKNPSAALVELWAKRLVERVAAAAKQPVPKPPVIEVPEQLELTPPVIQTFDWRADVPRMLTVLASRVDAEREILDDVRTLFTFVMIGTSTGCSNPQCQPKGNWNHDTQA
ncbi:hypothetical protein BC828DRAFT_299888 [Blastocladiella britannica]|nr:hypothetical protein BC828DRAFT_299888 [Blastocladiella britannica]